MWYCKLALTCYLNQELVVYKELSMAQMQRDQFAPSFQQHIQNFESLAKCKVCTCFEKASAYGLCRLCYFYARQGLHENLMKSETALPEIERTSSFEELLNLLVQTVFGFQAAHENQKQAIEAYVAGKHTFVIMPTGSGKSMCFWASAVLSSRLTIVFEPLIALIQDQMVSNWRVDLFDSMQLIVKVLTNFRQSLLQLAYLVVAFMLHQPKEDQFKKRCSKKLQWGLPGFCSLHQRSFRKILHFADSFTKYTKKEAFSLLLMRHTAL
jgi:hypothetical protein